MQVYQFLKTLAKVAYRKTFLLRKQLGQSEDVVLIVGNGPSLKSVDLFDIRQRGIELCCVNSFAFENDDFFKLKPKYYCAVDPDIYSANALYPEDNRKFYECMSRVDWPMTYICMCTQRLPVNNPNISYVYLPNVVYDEEYHNSFFYRNFFATYTLQNVIGACLFYCISSKMKRVFLIGVENDWHKELIVGEDNTVYRKKEHFYGSYLENVTETGIIKKGELYKYFEYYVKTLKCYYSAAKYAEQMNVPVYNLTIESYIDTFEKKREIW